MCLINFQFQTHPNYKLIVAANRDEFYERPTAPAQLWEDHPNILAGRDLLKRGTWLGITKKGRFAALTNFRDPNQVEDGKKSRGKIVKQFLTSNTSPQNFLKHLQESKDDYVGFNLIVGNPEELYYYNNIGNEITKITPGTYGLSNHFLNTPWPKVVKGRKRLNNYVSQQSIIQPEPLFEMLTDRTEAPDQNLPNTGVGIELERKLSPLFIQTSDYGTRSSTVLFIDQHNDMTFVERTYNQESLIDEKRYRFQLTMMG